MEFLIRPATRDDLPAIVALLADDPLGRRRESPADPAPYLAAFEAIDADPHQLLVVGELAAGPAGSGGPDLGGGSSGTVGVAGAGVAGAGAAGVAGAGVAGAGGQPGGGAVAATMQLTFIPGLSRQGAWRAQIEGVRVAAAARGHRLGERLIRWAIAQARERGAVLVQLTSDNSRPDAHRFYQRFGFVASHTGFKLDLRDDPPGGGGR